MNDIMKVNSIDNVKYWGADADTRKLAASLTDRIVTFDSFLTQHHMWIRWDFSAKLYDGVDPKTGAVSYDVRTFGESDELLTSKFNLYRRTLDSAHILITGVRPAFEPQALGDDSAVTEATSIASQILEDALSKRRGEATAIMASKYALLYGAGWHYTHWDKNDGDLFTYVDNETGLPVQQPEGNVCFAALPPSHVIYDVSCDENSRPDWYIVSRQVNKWELAARFPEYADHIVACGPTDRERFKNSFLIGNSVTISQNNTDSVTIYEFLHERTNYLEGGRHSIMVGGMVVADGPLEYKKVPLYELSSTARIPRTRIATTHFFDVMGMQRAIDASFSSALSINDVLGIPNIWIGMANMLGRALPEIMGRGVRYIMSQEEPKLLEWSGAPIAQQVSFMEFLKGQIVEISRLNDVALGNSSGATSGKHLSMAHAIAQQSASDYQAAYAMLFEQVGLCILEMFRDFASEERTILMTGRNKTLMAKRFKDAKIDAIKGISINVGSALMRTAAGRKEVADMMFDKGVLNPEQYLEMIATGKLEPMTEGPLQRRVLIENENQMLMNGVNPPVLDTDNPMEHFEGHLRVMNDPTARNTPSILMACKAHFVDHIVEWERIAMKMPALAAALGYPPPPSVQPPMGPNMNTMPPQPDGTMPAPPPDAQMGPEGPMPSIPTLPGGGAAPSIGNLPTN